jgi:hypothetical protein
MASHEHTDAADRPGAAPGPSLVRERLDYFDTYPSCGYHAEAVVVTPPTASEGDVAHILLRCGMPCGWHRWLPDQPPR